MLQIIIFFGDVFFVINLNRFIEVRRIVEKKVGKLDNSDVKNKKFQIFIKDKIFIKLKKMK